MGKRRGSDDHMSSPEVGDRVVNKGTGQSGTVTRNYGDPDYIDVQNDDGTAEKATHESYYKRGK